MPQHAKHRDRTITAPTRRPLSTAISLALVIASAQVGAASILVDTDLDALPAVDGQCNLREAVGNANGDDDANPDCAAGNGADQILFGPNTKLIQLIAPLDISDNLVITGPPEGLTLVGSGATRLLAVPAPDVALALENLVLTQGFTDSDGAPVPECIRSTGEGGALCSLGPVTLTNSAILNSATTGNLARGGGMFVAGDVVLTGSVISGNTTTGLSAQGGGLSATGNAVVNNSRIEDNTTGGEQAGGGGLAISGTLSVTNSTIAGNSTSEVNAPGGGARVVGSVVMSHSTLRDNRTDGDASHGGGLSLEGELVMINTTVSGNTTLGAGAPGGGIRLFGDGQILNSTVTENSATAGGGGVHGQAYGDDGLSLTSTILAANTAPEGNFSATVLGGGFTLDANSSLFGDPGIEINGVEADNHFTNLPDLEPLVDNGCNLPAGTTGDAACVATHALLPDSPALDTGIDSVGLDSDQRGTGFPRTIGMQTDIGAYEADFSGLNEPIAVPVTGWIGGIILAGLLTLLGLGSLYGTDGRHPRSRIVSTDQETT